MELTTANIEIGTVIINKSNPEWGTWRVAKKTDFDGSIWYDINSACGARVLHTDEFHFWEIVK